MADQTSLYSQTNTDAVTETLWNTIMLDINARLQRLEERGAFSFGWSDAQDLVGLTGIEVATIPCPGDFKNPQVAIGVKDLPTGDDVEVDILRSAVSFFNVTAKPKIVPAGAKVSAFVLADNITSLVKGDPITFKITKVGSGTPGKGLSVIIFGEPQN